MRDSIAQLIIFAVMCGVFGGLYAAETTENDKLKTRVKQLENALQEIIARCKQ